MDRIKTIEHWFKALVFRAFGGTLKRGCTDFKPLDGKCLKKVLFLRPEKLGDMVISFPVFDGLKKYYPHIKISILGSPRNEAIIRGDPRFDKVYMYRKNIWRDLQQMKAIRREEYDCVVDMICDDSVTALFLSQFAAPGKPRIGVGKNKYRKYYDFNYDHRMGDTGHIIENTLKLLMAFNIDPSTADGYAPPFVSKYELRQAEVFIAQVRNGNPDGLVVGYNLSAGSSTRIWAKEKSVELINRILEDNRIINVVLFTIPSERGQAERIKGYFKERVELVPDDMNLLQASALISKLNLLITPDTSLVHIARSFRIPVVGLYSRFMKNFLLWRPFGQETGAVVSDNDDNIFDITVDKVFDAYQAVLDSYSEKEKQ
ncbi:MAG: glycosyltransferase family 9 protein [candidate division Zixibacteria bacterium]|nr:glycosyltransferase family 9 protein [candidate division Zixibacteria bacterium]